MSTIPIILFSSIPLAVTEPLDSRVWHTFIEFFYVASILQIGLDAPLDRSACFRDGAFGLVQSLGGRRSELFSQAVDFCGV